MSEEQITIASKKDFRIDTFFAGGPGGQAQNKIATGVRFTHIPSGIQASCRETSSQLENKKRAFRRIAPMVYQWWKQENDPEFVQEKVTETVRTYHEPDNRVTDHASGFKQAYKSVMKDIGPMIEARFKQLKKEELHAEKTEDSQR